MVKNVILIVYFQLIYQAKSGINPSDCLNLVSSIVSNYKNLEFSGFMTIGEPNPSDPFRDFEVVHFMLFVD